MRPLGAKDCGGMAQRGRSKKVTCFTGIVVSLNLTFSSDDDDFNVSDAIMSRILRSCGLRRRGFQGSKDDSPPTCIHQRHKSTFSWLR